MVLCVSSVIQNVVGTKKWHTRWIAKRVKDFDIFCEQLLSHGIMDMIVDDVIYVSDLQLITGENHSNVRIISLYKLLLNMSCLKTLKKCRQKS